MPKDPTIAELNRFLQEPTVTFEKGLMRADSDSVLGYVSDLKNFDINYGVAKRRRGSSCLHNPTTAYRWRAFKWVNIAGADVLLGITQKRELKAMLSKWPEILFPVYRKGVSPMTYPSQNKESYEILFERGDEFWMDNEDGQYLKIINNYGDAIRIDKRGYIQAMKIFEAPDQLKPTYLVDEARSLDTDIALYMDVKDATNRLIEKFYITERDTGDTVRVSGLVKVAGVNECGVVSKLSDAQILTDPKEMFVSTIPAIAVNKATPENNADGTITPRGNVDLKYQGTVLTDPDSEEGSVYATRDENGVKYKSSPPSQNPVAIDFWMICTRLGDGQNPDPQLILIPKTSTETINTATFSQFPPLMVVTGVWDGEDFDESAGTPVPINFVEMNTQFEVVLGAKSGNYPTEIDAYSLLTAPTNTMTGLNYAAEAYSVASVGSLPDRIEEKLGAISDRANTVALALSTTPTVFTTIYALFEVKTWFSKATTPYDVADVAYKYQTDAVLASTNGFYYGISDRGMDLWKGAGDVSLGNDTVIDVKTKQAVISGDNVPDALVSRTQLDGYTGSFGQVGLGKAGAFAVWNDNFLLGTSQVGWQRKSESFNFKYTITDDDIYNKSIDDGASTGRVVNQTPYSDIRLQSSPIMSMDGLEIRRRAYVEPVIYETITDPRHIVTNEGRVFVVQGAQLWIGNFSSLMLDTVVEIDFTVDFMESFYDGAILFTNKGIKKVTSSGGITNVNTEQIKTERVKAVTKGGSMAFAVSELDEVFRVIMVFEGTTVPYPKAILASAPIHAMDWGASPKMCFVDGTLWVARQSDVWGLYQQGWTKQKSFEGKNIDHIFNFKDKLCIAFYDVADLSAEDTFTRPRRS
jgi:hypothetical protein